MKTIAYCTILFVVVFLLVMLTGGNPSSLFLFPIIFGAGWAGWYLNQQIQKDHKENISKGIRYEKEEQDAEHWLHHSFAPQTKLLLLRKQVQVISIGSALFLSFIFIWSFFIEGLLSAFTNTLMAVLLIVTFVAYLLVAPKWIKMLFKQLPRSVRHYQRNAWIHGYLLLLPFSALCFWVYSFPYNRGEIITNVLAIPVFIFIYTLICIGLFCINYLYQEYKRDEEKKLKKFVKDMFTD